MGFTEKKARETHDVVAAVVQFRLDDAHDYRRAQVGFCKLIADRKTYRILSCHVVGEQAVDLVRSGGNRHRGRNARRRFGSCPTVVSDLRRHPGQCGG